MKEQIELFDYTNPLRAPAWDTFFSELPKKAGIYKMFDNSGSVIYVGKAKNLKQRVQSYRYQHLNSCSRKVLRMIAKVQKIEIECCDDELGALVLEDTYIKEFRPEYNVMNANPELYYYVRLGFEQSVMEMSIGMRILETAKEEGKSEPLLHFGAFKGHRTVRNAVGAMLRICYLISKRQLDTRLLPPVLHKKLCPQKYSIQWPVLQISKSWQSMMIDYFRGRSFRILVRMIDHLIKQKESIDTFSLSLIQKDIDHLFYFFYRSCKPLWDSRKEREGHNLSDQNDLDRILIKWAKSA